MLKYSHLIINEPKMTKTIILDFLSQHKAQIQEKFGIQKIGLFGSYAKNEARDNSDIDIAILSDKKDFFLREDLKDYLQDSLKVSVDVGYLDSFREFYRKKIEQEIIYV
jgi:predicted nucleotidyltransferase